MTRRAIKKKIKTLERILKERLPHIKRWRKVSVILDCDTFTIYWSDPKTAKNHHPFESKQMPISDIDIIINRNKSRLRNESKLY